MPAELLKPTKGTPSDTTSAAGVWAREELQDHMRELEYACQDRTPASLQSINNRREKLSVAAHETRAARKMDAFDRRFEGLPTARTV